MKKLNWQNPRHNNMTTALFFFLVGLAIGGGISAIKLDNAAEKRAKELDDAYARGLERGRQIKFD